MWFGNHSEPQQIYFEVCFGLSARKTSEEEGSYLSVMTDRRCEV